MSKKWQRALRKRQHRSTKIAGNRASVGKQRSTISSKSTSEDHRGDGLNFWRGASIGLLLGAIIWVILLYVIFA
jgi:hypothetical protein